MGVRSRGARASTHFTPLPHHHPYSPADVWHYALHHAGVGGSLLARARGYHRHHHAQGTRITAAFGVSPLAWVWDGVFGTTFAARAAAAAAPAGKAL